VLTTFDLDECVYDVLRGGDCGFLLKDAPEDQLIAAIRIAADGGSMFATTVTGARSRSSPARPGRGRLPGSLLTSPA
jgi:DNA-binding NarL/FixJ family response regulator